MKKSNSVSLVFIAGIGHSGSTIFDLLLGAQPGVTGLGEVDVFINSEKKDWYLERFDKYPCTCERTPSECKVWGKIKPFLDKAKDKSYGEIYRKIFETALNNTETNIIVDSSKNLNALTSVHRSLEEIGISPDQFFVILLAKDVRSFATSAIRAGRSSSVLKSFRHWKKANLRFYKYLTENNIKTLHIGYDELTLSTKYLMEKVMLFISDGVKKNIALDVSKTNSHIISGNKMRLYQAENIWYDYRWFNDSKVNFCYTIYPSLSRLNKQLVYSNVEYFLEKDSKFKPPKNNSQANQKEH